MKHAGFTLVELVLVVALLGILALVAVPFIANSSITTARTSSMSATVGAVQSGIALYAAQTGGGSYPASLDSAANNSSATGSNPLFGTVLQNGVTSQWFKVSSTCYVYDTDGDGIKDANPTDTYYSYNSTAGTFTLAVSGCT
jgi:prepilin-type N-terminal cleavage/methylation domain-containing protein